LDYRPHLNYFENKNIEFFHGDEDPLITPERLTFIRGVIQQTGLSNVREKEYSGKHSVVRSVLKEWFDNTVRV
ncbi:MAG: hypothetical protein AAF705_04735, partial [Bacteroidota bacterium]